MALNNQMTLFKPDEEENEAVILKYDDNRQVAMSNELARAHQGLILIEKRVVALGLSKIDSRYFVDPRIRSNFSTEITAQEYSQIYGISMPAAYIELQTAARKLYERNVRFYFKVSNSKNEAEINVRWLTQAIYYKGEGRIEIWWNPRIIDHITGLRAKFTTYKLMLAQNFKSIYSWRLFELLMTFFSTKVANYPIEEFWYAMEVTEKQKANFGYIRRRIIEPAIKEITEKSHFKIAYTTTKRGKRITSINFKYSIDKEKLNIGEEELQQMEKDIENEGKAEYKNESEQYFDEKISETH
jgi:plasmid replication initiation protein